MNTNDTNLDGIITDQDNSKISAALYAEQLSTQLKKGSLNYCVLLSCEQPSYTSEIIEKLMSADLEVVEGTIYPLLSRMRKDGLLSHTWQESTSGPPRKYYKITPYGTQVRAAFGKKIKSFNQAIIKLEKGTSHE